MSQPQTRPTRWEKTSKRNTIHLFLWTASWTATIALLAFGPQLLWDFNTTLTLLATVLNFGIGIGMVLANIRQLRGADEMQQKIILEAAALTLGITLIFGGSYQLWQDIQLISFEAEISHLMLLMGVTYIINHLIGFWRYR